MSLIYILLGAVAVVVGLIIGFYVVMYAGLGIAYFALFLLQTAFAGVLYVGFWLAISIGVACGWTKLNPHTEAKAAAARVWDA